jgi:hypothetical protein
MPTEARQERNFALRPLDYDTLAVTGAMGVPDNSENYHGYL